MGNMAFTIWVSESDRVRLEHDDQISKEDALALADAIIARFRTGKPRLFRWTPEATAELTARYQAGEPVPKIAAALGTSLSSAYGQINKLGIANRKPGTAEALRARYGARKVA